MSDLASQNHSSQGRKVIGRKAKDAQEELEEGVFRYVASESLNNLVKTGQRELVRGGLVRGFGWVDFDAALEIGAVLDADARGRNVSGDGAVLFNVHTATRVDVARDFAEGHHVAGMNLGIELGGGTNGEFVTLEADGAVDDAVNLQVFGTGDLPFDLYAGAEACTTAGRDAAEFT
jgi:hypothetical protein